MESLTIVLVGVLTNSRGEVLISKRPDDKHLGGFWEFPGGKLDAGESDLDALKREFLEEVGVTVKHAEFCFELQHDYPGKSVLLKFWEIIEAEGEAVSNEGQLVRWVAVRDLKQYEFPEGNQEIIHYISENHLRSREGK